MWEEFPSWKLCKKIFVLTLIFGIRSLHMWSFVIKKIVSLSIYNFLWRWISIQQMWFAQLAQFAGEWFFFNLHLSRTKCVLNKFFLFTNQMQPLQSFWYEHHCKCYKKLASKSWPVLNMILRNYSLCQLVLKMKNFHLISNEKKTNA